MKAVSTTMGIGSPPREFSVVKTENKLINLIKNNKKYRWRVIGEGSNIVFSDEGFNGLIIKNEAKELKINGNNARVGAGNNLNDFIKTVINKGLAGMEKMSGIPGTVGGAIYGCAGAYGQEIKDRLVRVKVFDGQKIKWLTKQQCKFGYRNSIFKRKSDWVILGTELRFKKITPGDLKKTAKEIIKIRNKKYLPKLKCAGSFFKNIILKEIKPGSLRKKILSKLDKSKIISGKVPAGYLLDLVDVRGMRIGDVAVSKEHGNIIYNAGRGTFSDLQKLVKIAKQKVHTEFGIKLEEEVQYLK